MAGRRLSLPRAEGHQSNSPQVVVRTRSMAVLMKPPGWEVDGPHSEGSQSFLSDFLRKEFPTDLLPQLCDFQYGFIHRLDVPSSGLVLVGRSFEGLYSLRFQINSLSMQREYFVLCHGPAPASLRQGVSLLRVKGCNVYSVECHCHVQLAVGQHHYHFGVGAPRILDYVSGWIEMFTGGTIWVLTHSQLACLGECQGVQPRHPRGAQRAGHRGEAGLDLVQLRGPRAASDPVQHGGDPHPHREVQRALVFFFFARFTAHFTHLSFPHVPKLSLPGGTTRSEAMPCAAASPRWRMAATPAPGFASAPAPRSCAGRWRRPRARRGASKRPKAGAAWLRCRRGSLLPWVPCQQAWISWTQLCEGAGEQAGTGA